MYLFAAIGSLMLLVGAFLRYTSRPDLFPEVDTPTSPGGRAAIGAGLAALVMTSAALEHHRLHILKFLWIPAGFTAFQLVISLRLMASVARRTGERVGPGPGLVLSVLGAVVVGYVAYRADQPPA